MGVGVRVGVGVGVGVDICLTTKVTKSTHKGQRLRANSCVLVRTKPRRARRNSEGILHGIGRYLLCVRTELGPLRKLPSQIQICERKLRQWAAQNPFLHFI